ncbi:SDR family NAD(P)-dependent oxidoreductase [Sporosarcina soli]|uniref:SDR family NAD(P)-dependent oxidoreductase n=1 Tax=Sporosarcina soli TaxID=334736 RepID=A0ABW0TLG9_9BACL
MKLDGKVALVTGAGQGIGKVYAKRLANEGAKVVIADINYENAKKVEEEIRGNNQEALAIEVNVIDENQINKMTKKIVETYERIDILVNNAAMFSTIKLKPFEEISDDEWDRVVDINLKGIFMCCKAIVPVMKEQKSGRIINISSATVLMGKPHYIHYVSSKAGVIGLSRSLAREVGDYNITVNTIAPGYTTTEVPRGTITEEVKNEILKGQCIKRFAEPEDLAGLVAFLSSDDASYITGQMINVDGGFLMY